MAACGADLRQLHRNEAHRLLERFDEILGGMQVVLIEGMSANVRNRRDETLMRREKNTLDAP
jgi:hypothetical protein